MTHVGYLAAGYGVTTVALGGYAWSVLRRARAAARDAARSIPGRERR